MRPRRLEMRGEGKEEGTVHVFFLFFLFLALLLFLFSRDRALASEFFAVSDGRRGARAERRSWRRLESTRARHAPWDGEWPSK